MSDAAKKAVLPEAGSALFDNIDAMSYEKIVELVGSHSDEVEKLTREQYEKLQDVIYRKHYCTIPGVQKMHAVFSISDQNEKYKMRLLMTSLVRFLFRAREEYKASESEKQAILKFLLYNFKFDPNRHIRESRQAIDDDPERKEVARGKHVAADLPANAFANWEAFHSTNFESIVEMTRDLYGSKPDINFAINILKVFEGLDDANEFARLHNSKFASLFTIETNKWAILGPFRENRERLQYYGQHAGIVNTMLEGTKSDADIGKDIIRHRVTSAKKETYLKHGPDDSKGLEQYSQLRCAFNRELTPDEIKKLQDEAEAMKGTAPAVQGLTPSVATPAVSAATAVTTAAENVATPPPGPTPIPSPNGTLTVAVPATRPAATPNPTDVGVQKNAKEFGRVVLDGQKIDIQEYKLDDKGKIAGQPDDTIAVPIVRMNEDGSVDKGVFFSEAVAPDGNSPALLQKF